MKIFLLLATFAIPLFAFSQAGTEKIELHGTGIDSLFIYNTRTNTNQGTLEGYRIQIYSGSGVSAKKEALEAQNKFLESWSKERIFVTYNAPFWRVRIGDYRYRGEALSLLQQIKKQFPGSYIVRDNTVRKKAFY